MLIYYRPLKIIKYITRPLHGTLWDTTAVRNECCVKIQQQLRLMKTRNESLEWKKFIKLMTAMQK